LHVQVGKGWKGKKFKLANAQYPHLKMNFVNQEQKFTHTSVHFVF